MCSTHLAVALDLWPLLKQASGSFPNNFDTLDFHVLKRPKVAISKQVRDLASSILDSTQATADLHCVRELLG